MTDLRRDLHIPTALISLFFSCLSVGHASKAINTEIAALNFQNCKVVVSQLDTQPSTNDGVIIMVLGKMSNNNGPERKFAQTFFLASEEPGRYYVLNDLFRFLHDEVLSSQFHSI